MVETIKKALFKNEVKYVISVFQKQFFSYIFPIKYSRLLIASLFVATWVYLNTNVPWPSEHINRFLFEVTKDRLLYDLIKCLFFAVPIIISFFLIFKNSAGFLFSKMEKGYLIRFVAFFVYLEFVLSFGIAFICRAMGIEFNAHVGIRNVELSTYFELVVGLIAEQLFFFLILFFALATLYKMNKKISTLNLLLSMAFAALVFGLAHLSAYDNNVLQCLLIIGIPFTVIQTTIFLITKNMLAGYLVHLFFDLVIFSIANF